MWADTLDEVSEVSSVALPCRALAVVSVFPRRVLVSAGDVERRHRSRFQLPGHVGVEVEVLRASDTRQPACCEVEQQAIVGAILTGGQAAWVSLSYGSPQHAVYQQTRYAGRSRRAYLP